MARAFNACLILALTADMFAIEPAAHAGGKASRSGDTLTYVSGSEDNSLSVQFDGSQYTFWDSALSSVSAGSGCSSETGPAGPMPEASCDASGVRAIVLRTGGGSDTTQISVGTSLPSGVALTVYLGPGADSWSGSRAGRETVYGGDGNDAIDTYGGNDRVYGEAGRDTIDGGGGNDVLRGGPGPDDVSGRDGHDAVRGDGGDDKLYGNTGRDALYGGDGGDLLSGGLASDALDGNAGNDRLIDDDRGQASSFLSADNLVGGGGTDTVDYHYRMGEATALRLSLDGRANDGANNEGDNISGSVENIIGGRRSDVITGSGGKNVLTGNEGNDIIRGNGGDDTVRGDAGNDELSGGGDDDVLEGWWGDDWLNGGGGNDELHAGIDDDVIRAEDGNRDVVSCSDDFDKAYVDGKDDLSRCERIF